MGPSDDTTHSRIEAILGPCPVDRHHEAYSSWLKIGQVVWEAQARLTSTMLDKASNTPLELLPGVVVDAVAGHYDIVAGVIAATVTDYESAAEAERNLEKVADSIFKWALAQIREGPRTIREGVSQHDIRSRLRQRSAHWTLKVLGLAREAEEVTIVTQTASPAPTFVAPPSAELPTTTQRFPDRAAWLQKQLDDRRWTVKDLERRDGPNARTVRKILDGQGVRQTVLEKLAHALSLKKLVKLSDIPNS